MPESILCVTGPHEKVPGRRGRPPGSKNKRTLAMESLAQQGLTAGQQQAAMALLKQRAEQKRLEDEESLQASIASGQKRRGRPPGSRNRPREDGVFAHLPPSQVVVHQQVHAMSVFKRRVAACLYKHPLHVCFASHVLS